MLAPAKEVCGWGRQCYPERRQRRRSAGVGATGTCDLSLATLAAVSALIFAATVLATMGLRYLFHEPTPNQQANIVGSLMKAAKKPICNNVKNTKSSPSMKIAG